MEVIGDCQTVACLRQSEYEQEMTFLKEPCPVTGDSLHRHLCDIVHFALATKAAGPAGLDAFEECSRMLRMRRAVLQKPPSCRSHGKGDRYEFALRARRALKGREQERRSLEAGIDDDGYGDHPGDHAAVLDSLALLRRCGLGVDPEEGLAVALAVKRFAEARTLIRIRFWGKVLARGGDYTVVEAELTDDELDRRADLLGPAEQAELEDVLNRKVYLVCSDPCGGDEWRELPPIRPAHVVAARGRDSSPALLSGRLDAQVRNFLGTEAHLLHAQLVRISAACAVSPAGAFTRSPPTSQDLAEDEFGVMLNADWLGAPAGASLNELADPALWVHHAPCLLQSGRPADPDQEEEEGVSSEDVADQNPEDEEEEEEEEEEEDEEGDGARAADDIDEEDEDSLRDQDEEREQLRDEDENGGRDVEEPEDAPALLTPLAQDAPLSGGQQGGASPAWTSRVCSPLQRTVLLRSLRWPGAVAYCSGRKFGYIYFGWAVKAVSGARMNCGEDLDRQDAADRDAP